MAKPSPKKHVYQKCLHKEDSLELEIISKKGRMELTMQDSSIPETARVALSSRQAKELAIKLCHMADQLDS